MRLKTIEQQGIPNQVTKILWVTTKIKPKRIQQNKTRKNIISNIALI